LKVTSRAGYGRIPAISSSGVEATATASARPNARPPTGSNAPSRVGISLWLHRTELPPYGINRFWRYIRPLTIDLPLAAFGWAVISHKFQTPIATISPFAPDVFVIVVLITNLGLSWVYIRTQLTLRATLIAER